MKSKIPKSVLGGMLAFFVLVITCGAFAGQAASEKPTAATSTITNNTTGTPAASKTLAREKLVSTDIMHTVNGVVIELFFVKRAPGVNIDLITQTAATIGYEYVDKNSKLGAAFWAKPDVAAKEKTITASGDLAIALRHMKSTPTRAASTPTTTPSSSAGGTGGGGSP